MIQLNFTVIIQIINFLVLLLILNALLYKPIMAKMRERDSKIKGDREKAEQLETKVLDQDRKHQEAVAKTRQEAAQENSELIAAAKKDESDILDKARAEATKIVDAMRATIQSDAGAARKALKAEMAQLAQSISEKILGRAL